MDQLRTVHRAWRSLERPLSDLLDAHVFLYNAACLLSPTSSFREEGKVSLEDELDRIMSTSMRLSVRFFKPNPYVLTA